MAGPHWTAGPAGQPHRSSGGEDGAVSGAAEEPQQYDHSAGESANQPSQQQHPAGCREEAVGRRPKHLGSAEGGEEEAETSRGH